MEISTFGVKIELKLIIQKQNKVNKHIFVVVKTLSEGNQNCRVGKIRYGFHAKIILHCHYGD